MPQKDLQPGRAVQLLPSIHHRVLQADDAWQAHHEAIATTHTLNALVLTRRMANLEDEPAAPYAGEYLALAQALSTALHHRNAPEFEHAERVPGARLFCRHQAARTE